MVTATINGGCKVCGHPFGELRQNELHVGLYCAECDTWQRWVSKRDAGVDRRSLSSRRNITPSVRARVLQRDGYRCILCGFGPPDKNLVMGHIISVRDGLEIGLTDGVLYDEWNLCTMCEECNSGLGERSLHLPEALRAYHRWQLERSEQQSA